MALVYDLMKRWIDMLFVGVTTMTNKLEGDTKYFVPYDWHVNLPSYLTYSEAVLGACGVAAIVARQPGSRGHKVIVSALTIFTIGGGPVFKPFINIYLSGEEPVIAVLSYAQFTFETLALALMTTGLWMSLGPNGSQRLKRNAADGPPPRARPPV